MKRIIILSVSLGLIAVIAIATILMAVFSTGSIPNIAKPDLRVYYATKDSGEQVLRSKTANDNREQELIDSIWEEFNKAPKQRIISGMFNGTLDEGVVYKEYPSGAKYENISTKEENKLVIAFEYSEEKYVDEKGNPTTKEKKDQAYDVVVMTISAEDARTEVEVKIGTWSSGGRVKCVGQYAVTGNFANLYKFVTEIKTAA